MRVAFIGDIVGRVGRNMLKTHLKNLRDEYKIDYVVANSENASHGFGLTPKNGKELLSYGVDVMTGGNHTWDKKEIEALLRDESVLRPANYPSEVVGSGVKKTLINDEKFAVINLMGVFSMPAMTDNPFKVVQREIEALKSEGYEAIFIDFHAEATSEKRALHCMLRGKVSAICGSHTHIGTDDLIIDRGTFYVSDIGLTGCRDNVIGMDEREPIKKFLTALPAKYDVPKNCKAILQIAIIDIEDGEAIDGFKLKIYNDRDEISTLKAFKES